MKKSLIALVALAAQTSGNGIRAKTRDISYGYRMPAGFPGDVNRTHPVSIEPVLLDTVDPVRLYGDPVILNAANGVRGFKAGDTATKIYGIAVRPYPTQQESGGMSSAIGAAVPPTKGVLDVIREGYVVVKCNNGAPVKGGAVFVRIAAATGPKPLGGLEAVADGGNTLALTNCWFNGPVDANGITELVVAVA